VGTTPIEAAVAVATCPAFAIHSLRESSFDFIARGTWSAWDENENRSTAQGNALAFVLGGMFKLL